MAYKTVSAPTAHRVQRPSVDYIVPKTAAGEQAGKAEGAVVGATASAGDWVAVKKWRAARSAARATAARLVEAQRRNIRDNTFTSDDGMGIQLDSGPDINVVGNNFAHIGEEVNNVRINQPAPAHAGEHHQIKSVPPGCATVRAADGAGATKK